MQQIIKKSDILTKLTDNFEKTLTLSHNNHDNNGHNDEINGHDDEINDDNDDYDDDDDDFEFFIGGDRKSPISAEDIFQNGQIRPIFPFSDETRRNSDGASTSYTPPVKKLFVASSPEKEISDSPYRELSPEISTPAPEMSRKSNSTGFSKLWRVRDLLVRSHSDGKDAFVFLGKSEEEKKKKGVKMAANPKIRVSKGEKEKEKKSAYEVLYGKKRMEKKGGRSYLPYRQELVGFFTSASGGMTRNVHPY